MTEFDWDIVYERAIRKDGSLLFPERLSTEFLERARRSQGSRIFANQYLNEVVSDDDRMFRPEWRRYWHTPEEIPRRRHTFAFLDPAISLEDGADYTALAVVSVDSSLRWFCRRAYRARINPTQTIELLFRTFDEFEPMAIGIESVAYQKALIHFVRREMERRGKWLPIREVTRGPDATKEMRIMRLVPQMEFGTLFLAHGMKDFEDELEFYPRGAHDDLLDAFAGIHDIVSYPTEVRDDETPPNPADPKYESWFIRQLHRRQNYGDSHGE